MSLSRIEIFEQMLTTDPGNTMVLFGLAKEYEKAGRDQELIETLNRYLEAADERTGQRDKARDAYERGIETAQRHGHPGMAEEYRMTLAGNYED